jgi:hypothetical protein
MTKIIENATQTIRPGYNRNTRLMKNSFKQEFFSYDRLIKNPLIKKNMGTPGNKYNMCNIKLPTQAVFISMT